MNNSSSISPQNGDVVTKLKLRDGIVYTVLLVGGALMLLGSAFPQLFGPHTSLTIPGLALLWMLTTRAIAAAFGKLDRRTVDPRLTERANEIITGNSHVFGTVRIDNSLRGLSRSFWQRDGNDIVVSRHACDTFTPEEVDFALASAACRSESPSGTRWDLIGIVFVTVVCFPAFFALTPRSMLLLLLIVIIAGFSLATTYADRLHAARRLELDIAADEAAVDITGNVDAAESALTKLAEHSPASAKVDERLQRIRYARYRTTASPLPPVC